MRLTLLGLALVAALPAAAQIEFNRGPDEGATCGQFRAMAPAEQVEALTAIEPVGGELPGSDPAIVRQWVGEVADACEGHPDLPLAEAATRALGGN